MRKREQHNLLKLVAMFFVILFNCQLCLANSQADFNRDGIVNLDDLSVLANTWLVVDTTKTGFVVVASDASNESKTRADYICDGTDDDVEIQAAIDSLPAAGGKIYLTEGTFNTTSTINISDNIWLQGSGFSTIIDCGTLNDHIIKNEDVSNGNNRIKITDLKLDGSSQTNDKCGILFQKTNHPFIFNVFIVGSPDSKHGILYRESSNGRISSVTIEDPNDASIRLSYGSSYITVTDVISRNPGLYHFQINSLDSSGDENRHITVNNMIGYGANVMGAIIWNANSVCLTNLSFYNTSQNAVTIQNSSEITISNSVFHTNTEPESDLIWSENDASHINISNCICKNAQNHSISSKSPYTTITGCLSENSLDCGFRLTGDDSILANCTVDGSGGATDPRGLSTDASRIMVSGCIFKNTEQQGIYVGGGSGIIVSNCIFENNGAFVFQAANDADGVIFSNNVISNFAPEGDEGWGGEVFIAGDHVLIQGNSWINPPASIKRLIWVEGTANYVRISNNDFHVFANPVEDGGATNLTVEHNMLP